MEKSEVIILRVSPEELSRIRKKMLDVGVLNQSAYLRKMALDGYCVRLDLDEVKELNRLLRICSTQLELNTQNVPMKPAPSTKQTLRICRGGWMPSGSSRRSF